ncbi:transcription factor TRY-like [Rosa sericea]
MSQNMDNLLQDSTISISSSSITTSINSEEVSSMDCELIEMSEQEKDLINRMYRMVGDRWHLIAGRIPGRKAEEMERFWIKTHTESFAQNREENGAKN